MTLPQTADITQPSLRQKQKWPWWSIASLAFLVLIALACVGGWLAYSMRPTEAAAWPTAVFVTITPPPGPTYIVVTSAAPTPAPWSNLTRVVRVAGTQGLQLRIRSAPGTKSDTVKLVPDGTRLLIIGDGQQAEGQTWWPVRDPTDNKEGWAVSTYLAPDVGP